MTISTLNTMVSNGTLREHHTARYKRYISRRSDGVIEPYEGRYGKGYALFTPAFDSTIYCYITYYVFN